MTDPSPGPGPEVPDIGRHLAEAAGDWLCELDSHLVIRWTNGRVREVAGLEPRQAVGRPWSEVAGQSLPADALEAVRRRVPADFKSTVPPRDGHLERPGQAHLRPGPDGSWILAWSDRTRERQLASEARRLREWLDTAQDFGRLGVWERELPSGKGRWDQHVFEFWGLDPTEGVPSFDEAVRLVHPDDVAPLAERFRSSTQKPGRYSARYRVVRTDGLLRWIHSQWEVKAADGVTPDHIVGVMVDDTEAYELAQSADEASNRLRLAAELANVTIWKHDLRTNRIYHSLTSWVLPHLDPNPEGMPIEQLRELVHPDDMATVVGSAQRALESGRPIDFEARYRAKDGSWRHVLSRRALQRDEKGEPAAFLGVSLDLTDQMTEQRRSTELARRLAMAVSAGGIGLWSRRLDDQEAEWNAQMYTIYGRDPSLGPPSTADWLRMVHPEDLQIVQASMGDVRAHPGTSVQTQFRIMRPDGSTRWIENRATMEAGTSMPLLYGVALDMTERVHTELTLRSLNDRAQMVARGAGIGTWVLDLRSGRAVWDDQMFHLRGIPVSSEAPDEAGRLAMVHPEDRRLFEPPAMSDDADPAARAIEFRIVHADGRVRWLASRSSVVLDPAGRPALRVGVNWDVTEAKVAAQAREEREAAMRESRAKSQLLARVSHELRTPLNAILGFTQLLQLEVPAGSGAAAKLDNIRRAGEHLLSLINDVLDLTSLQTDATRLARLPLSLRAALDDAVALLAEFARSRDVAIVIRHVEGLAIADPVRLRQVLLNVLHNAIKFNRPGGTVWIDSRTDGSSNVIRMRDDGPGIPAERLAQVGEPFNRLGAEGRGVEGTGIGLSIVKALVEAMDGSFTVESPAGGGTTVEIALRRECDGQESTLDPDGTTRPVPLGGPGSVSAGTQGDQPPVGSGQVLYIEDNPVNVLLMQEFVRNCPGVDLSAAATGLEGVAHALTRRPDAVLIDMQLPDIDGYEVLRRLRADPRTRSLPCVALSANALQEDIERALAAGFDDYWTKPIDFSAFQAGLQKLLERARAEPLRDRQ
jgi:signal transduction histidine kinase/CheY-like chemotaxis protein